ncbi:mercuric reductase [Nocardiopsis mwathae]|uniref:Mercuric reductase n=1 Tax=Nocardiopsis mwathae TaxID=1472723 RepID=A0A7W9YHB0_9ACTN|nr:mercury(II) reductase [Nocardiopsis mwathae]MBB6171945.1 mercuric reductase [Nocardiopsis mwathae]
MRYDLAIVGSGSAGFAAAIAARRQGRSVVMIERGTIGGTCVNTGCVPSKALLAAAHAHHTARSAGRFPGLRGGPPRLDFAELVRGKDALVGAMRTAKYLDSAAEHGWEILTGTARFSEGPALTVGPAGDGGQGSGPRRIEAEHYLIATGSVPWTPPIGGLAATGYLTSTTALELDELPASLLVVGANSIGLELGQLFARLGTAVTLVETMERVAPFEEPEVSAALEQALTGEGLTVHTGARVSSVRRQSGQVTADIADASGYHRPLRADRILIATGRRPATAGLGLGGVGVRTGSRGEVTVDTRLRTDHPRVWAAGDVTGHPQFVYVAAAHGRLAVDNAFGAAHRSVDHRTLPRVVFTAPALAAVGLTAAQAREEGLDAESRVLPLEHVPRAQVDRDTRGLVKLVAERGSGRLLGAHMAGEGAGDVIATAVHALHHRMTVGDMAELWSPYLTMAEALRLAAQAFTRDVTGLSCCAS